VGHWNSGYGTALALLQFTGIRSPLFSRSAVPHAKATLIIESYDVAAALNGGADWLLELRCPGLRKWRSRKMSESALDRLQEAGRPGWAAR